MELGIFLKCPHPEVIEALGIAGVDFAVVDMEHTPLGPRDLYPLVLAAERRNLRLVVRVPENEPRWFRWALDLGVKDIQVPDVRTADDVARAWSAAFFAPRGNRGLCRFVRAAQFSSSESADYTNATAFKTRIIFQIEHFSAVHQISDTLTPGSTALIGPYDLSASLGVPGDIWNGTVIEFADRIIKHCKVSSNAVGVFADTPDGIEFWRKRGVDFIEYGSDLQLLMGAARDLKQWTNHDIP